MIQHLVLFSARREDLCDTIMETLDGYRHIPGVLDLSVSRNLKIDQLSNGFDIVLRVTFADEQALKAYKSHPIYIKGTDIIRPLRRDRVAVDFEIA